MSRNGLVRREGSKPAGTSLMASLAVLRACELTLEQGDLVLSWTGPDRAGRDARPARAGWCRLAAVELSPRVSSAAVEGGDQGVHAGVQPGRVRVPDPEVHRVQVRVPGEELGPGARCGLRAVGLARLRDERAVRVVTGRREEAERGIRQRRGLRNAGEDPLQGAKLPLVAGVLVDQDRRLRDVESG